MITQSLNEVELSVRKAAVGSGMPHGIAMETGRAAAWLAVAGLPALTLAADALEAYAEGRTAIGQAHNSGAGWWIAADDTPLCPCHAGIIAADLLNAGVDTVCLVSVSAPLLLVAVVAVVCQDRVATVMLGGPETSDAATVLVEQGAVSILSGGDLAEAWSTPSDVTIQLALSPSPETCPDRVSGDRRARERVLAEGAPAEPEAADRIARLAARTLVPASETSRERGAGAGRIDSD